MIEILQRPACKIEIYEGALKCTDYVGKLFSKLLGDFQTLTDCGYLQHHVYCSLSVAADHRPKRANIGIAARITPGDSLCSRYATTFRAPTLAQSYKEEESSTFTHGKFSSTSSRRTCTHFADKLRRHSRKLYAAGLWERHGTECMKTSRRIATFCCPDRILDVFSETWFEIAIAVYKS